MAIDDILGRIEAESRSAAEETVAAARRRAAEILADIETRAEKLGHEYDLKARKRSEEEEHRLVVSAQLEIRKSILAEKRKLLDAVCRKAAERIAEMPEKEYRTLVKELILARAISGREEIVVSAKQRKLLGADFVAELSEAHPGKGAFTLAAEAGDFRWGVVLREGRRVVNLTLEVLFGQLRERMEPAVAAILFPSEGH